MDISYSWGDHSQIYRGHMKRIATLAFVAVLTAAPAATSVAQTASPMVAPRSEAARPHPEAVAGMAPRYLITEFLSVESASGNATTSIFITNMSSRTCAYAIEFYYANGASLTDMRACRVRINVKKFGTAYPCTRGISNLAATSCFPVCSPELDFHGGKAIIYSSRVAECDRMAVNATIIHTSSDDQTVFSRQTPKIVKYSTIERPKTNKGD